ncbi:MAG: hypothetical protein FWE67_06080 [Planctomycetaceae bacterium]|nr:hypothetical protein [Planctomycetaceae bacterium]
MNIKTFRAESLQEGLRIIREELGDNVRILQTRQADETSFFGLRKHTFVEITVEDTSETEYADVYVEKKKMPSAQSENRKSVQVADIRQGNWGSLTMEQLNPTVLQRSMAAKLTDMVQFAGALTLKSDVCRIVAFVGTAGAGKTSLLVKVAAAYKNNEKKKVGLLTTDMFRIAAVEQLQRYGEILSVPVETASEPRKISAAIQRLGTCDLILIDTPAVNPAVDREEHVQFVDKMLREAEADDIQLVLSATGSAEFLTETVRHFAVLQPTGISFTHLDEAVGMSALYPFLQKNELPLHFVSLGQNIDCVETASPARLVCLI